MDQPMIPFSPPCLGEEEVNAVAAVIRSGWLTTGERCRAFEARFGASVQAPAALALASCTAGLHLALAALGLGPGDEVVVPDLTFCATGNVVEHCGARVVLADVEEDTLNLSPLAVERAISPRTRAVMVVHYAGHPADLEALRALCRPRGIALIEDAAHAVAASFRGRPVGSADDYCAFSFYATKNLTTGEGGMLTGRADLIERARRLALHGMDRDAWKRYGPGGSWAYEVRDFGFKYNLTDVQAAIGLVQLDRLPAMQDHRRAVAARYQKLLGSCDLLRLPVVRPEVVHGWHLYPVRLVVEGLSIDRAQVIERLKEQGIATSVHFIPLHRLQVYANRYAVPDAALPVASDAFPRLISLPLHARLTEAEVDRVAGTLLTILQEHRR